MRCPDCENELVIKNRNNIYNTVDIKHKSINAHCKCTKCNKEFRLTAKLGYPELYHLTEPVEMEIIPKTTLLRDFCPVCEENWKKSPDYEDFIIDNGDMHLVDEELDLREAPHHTWTHVLYLKYYCKKCNNLFKLPVKVKDVTFTEI